MIEVKGENRFEKIDHTVIPPFISHHLHLQALLKTERRLNFPANQSEICRNKA